MSHDQNVSRTASSQGHPKLVGRELGRSGLEYYLPGWIKRDFLPELQGRRLWLVYEQMGSNDAYVGAALNAYALFIRRAQWRVDPVVSENKDAAEFLEQCMHDMWHSWQTFIATAARPVLQFGFAPFEKVFKERRGVQDDERYSSKYDDGAIGWANFSFRSPDTILHWVYDPQDVSKLLGLVQLAAPDWRQIFIPIQKILNLRSDPGRDSPEGRSILRPVWRAWRTKTLLEDLRNIIIERGGAGIPWAEVPSHIANAPVISAAAPDSPAAADALASYNSIVEALENISQDTQKWLITPQIWNEQGQPTIKIGFLQPNAGADIISHITSAIDAEAKAILIATMTEFQALGMGGTGSLALSRDKTDNFTLAVAATCTSFQESINNQAVRQLFRLNPQFEFDRNQPLPRIIYDPLVPLNTQDVVAVLSMFERVGWRLDDQATIRDAILRSLGLPEFVEAKVRDLVDGHEGPVQDLLDRPPAELILSRRNDEL